LGLQSHRAHATDVMRIAHLTHQPPQAGHSIDTEAHPLLSRCGAADATAA
jgi:hypothetical protein